MSERPGDPAPVFPLIPAQELAWTGRVFPRYVAVCGAVVPAPALAEVTESPGECEFSPRMACCEECAREAIRQNHRAGLNAATVAAGD